MRLEKGEKSNQREGRRNVSKTSVSHGTAELYFTSKRSSRGKKGRCRKVSKIECLKTTLLRGIWRGEGDKGGEKGKVGLELLLLGQGQKEATKPDPLKAVSSLGRGTSSSLSGSLRDVAHGERKGGDIEMGRKGEVQGTSPCEEEFGGEGQKKKD